jgi:hypothetical protein
MIIVKPGLLQDDRGFSERILEALAERLPPLCKSVPKFQDDLMIKVSSQIRGKT